MLTKTDDESLLKALIAVPSVSSDIEACNRATEMMRAHLEKHGIMPLCRREYGIIWA